MRGFLYDVTRTGLLLVTLLAAIWCLLFIDSCLQNFTVRSVGPPPSYRDWEKKFTRIPPVRVQLTDPTKSQTVTIRSRQPIQVVRGAADANSWKQIPEGKPVQVTRRDEQILLDGEPGGEGPVRLQTEGGGVFTINGRGYRGNAVFRLHRETGLEVINRLPLNQYLWSVLRGEMKQGSPMEALRAQAIAARTYALWERAYQRNKNPAANYDVFDTTRSQLYRGISNERSRMRVAVKSTRGVILHYENDLIHTYYHSTCGGLTAHAAYALEHEEKPVPSPLQGAVECHWESHGRFHRWETRFTGSVLTNRIDDLPQSEIQRLNVTERTPNRRAKTVTATFSGEKKVAIDARTVRVVLSGTGVRSTWFQIEKIGANQFRVSGRGWGHGVGMCQTGSAGWAQEGASYEDILSRYYPGSSIAIAYE